MLKQRIEDDLKAAMLSGDSATVSTLKMIKSAILYKEVALSVRDTGLTDDQVIDVLSKEAKKRLEASTMYADAGRAEQSANEVSEYNLIQQYLPAQMSDDELAKVVDSVIADFSAVTMQDMGKVIGAVKSKVGATADGAKVATIVKQKLA